MYLDIIIVGKASPLRVFKSKLFSRFAKQEKISDASLVESVERAEKGLIDADLGGGVIKQRIARPGRGKSSEEVLQGVINRGGLIKVRDDEFGENV